MFTVEQHLDDLLRHLDRVRDNCRLVGERLIAQGRKDFGRHLIARGHVHDASKFLAIEWEGLHQGDDVDSALLLRAVKQHVLTNSHHPEYHGGIHNMPEIDIAEMVCDCAARAQESGTNIRVWFSDVAVEKYSIGLKSQQWEWIQSYLDVLLKTSFKKGVNSNG